MELNIKYLNLICTDLGGVGGHTLNINAENEICTLLGGVGGHTLELKAINEIYSLVFGSGTFKTNLSALNAILAASGEQPEITEVRAWKKIQEWSHLNYDLPWTDLPYFALPTNGVSLIAGETITIFGDTLVNVPISNHLSVTYTSDIGTQSGNNLVLSPTVGQIGDHSCVILVKNGTKTIGTYTINLKVIAKVTSGIKKIMMLGNSITNAGATYFASSLNSVLSGCTFTYVGTQGTTIKHEGRSGYKLSDFVLNDNSGVNPSPFFKAGVLNVPAYFADNSIAIPDYLHIRLTVNDIFPWNYLPWGLSGRIPDGQVTIIINNFKTLCDAFLALGIKIIIALPTICDKTGTGWNADYVEANVSQDAHIENIHKCWAAFVTAFESGAYSPNVDVSYEAINLDRANYLNGIHPDTTGDAQIGAGMAIKINETIASDKTAFVATFNTENAGSATKTIAIPCSGSGHNFVIDWGDGTIETKTGSPGLISHVYGTAGVKKIKITGTLAWLNFGAGGDSKKIVTLEQWGTGSWLNMEGIFRGCSNLVNNATDTPNTANITSLYTAFYQATLFNVNMASWNIANVTAANLVTNSSAITKANYDATLIGWAAQTVKPNLTINFGTVKYSAGAAATARGILTSAPNSWAITDGGQA